MSTRALVVATRGSPLALCQAERVVQLITTLTGCARCEVLVVQTTGDRLADAPIERIGGQGAFVKEVSLCVLEGAADIAVHSAKDLPSTLLPGLALAAVPERLDPRDALVGRRLEELRPGDPVATGSVRRRAQLAWLRPDLTFCELRGNMATRIEKAEKAGAGVLALAALQRLELSGRVAQVLEPATLLSQVGQGAIAVECRAGDLELRRMLSEISDDGAYAAVCAERAFLAALGGGCTLPCGALARFPSVAGASAGRTPLVIDGMLASRDGHVLVRRRLSGDDPQELGSRLAAELLDEAGGRFIEDFGSDRSEATSASGGLVR